MGVRMRIFVRKNGGQAMKKKKWVGCLELQRGQVSYEKIRSGNRIKGKIEGCYKNNKKQTERDR